jgi:hypothetical protein
MKSVIMNLILIASAMMSLEIIMNTAFVLMTHVYQIDHMGLNYHRVGQRCIYFDKSVSNYTVARTRCKSTFNGKGKMYEPTNFEESLKIAAEGKSKYNYPKWWLGVNDINEEGKLVFDSDSLHSNFA